MNHGGGTDGFNRTFLVLKVRASGGTRLRRCRFNRTFLVLKGHVDRRVDGEPSVSFNRTFLVLKGLMSVTRVRMARVLIAPFWY